MMALVILKSNSFHIKRVMEKFALLLIILLAFLLRAYRLDNQSYWIDEGWTLYFANLTPSELWQLLQTVVIKPPFYYLTIVYWVKLLGQSEYALRFYSLFFGVLAVPLTYRLAKDLGGIALGLTAALLTAVSPYQIWHAQDARMYSLLTAASLMSMMGFVRIINQKSVSPFTPYLIYIFGTEWAIMIHYHAFVLIGIQGLFLLITWQRHWRSYMRWGSTLGVVLLLYAPWFMRTWGLVKSYDNWIEQPTLFDSYLRSAIAYSVGELVPRPQALWLTLPFGVLYFIGLIYARTTFNPHRFLKPVRFWGGGEMLAFLVAFTLAPNLAAWLYGEIKTPVYLERYLIMVQIGYLLTLSIAIVNLPFIRRCLILLLLLAINGYVLQHHYFDPVYAKENWRGVAQTIEHFGLPGDAILLTGDGGEQLFHTYYKGNLPVYYPFNIFYLSHEGRLEGQAAIEALSKIAHEHRRLWYTPYGMVLDPMLEQWLMAQAYPAWQSWLGRKRLALYGSPRLPVERVETVNHRFYLQYKTDKLILNRVAMSAQNIAGDLLTLRFEFGEALPPGLSLSLRLINSQGDIFAQSDWPPLGSSLNKSSDQRALWIPVDLPPNNYLLQIVAYDSISGQSVGPPLVIPNIPIGAAEIIPPLTALDIPHRTKQPLGDFNIVGYALPDRIQPGQMMWLWLYWEFNGQQSESQQLRLSLQSEGESITTMFPMTESVGALDFWQAGQVRRAVYHWPTSPRLNGRTATLKVAVLKPDGQVQAETALAQIPLATRPRQFEIPPIAHRLNLKLGHPPKVNFMGYDLPTTEISSLPTPYPVHLYWQAMAEMEINYTVFVQLLNSNGQVVAQVDQQPLNGTASTTTWLIGEILTDSAMLNLPTLPLGDYRLIIGMYNAATGERLPVATGGDFIEVGKITIK